MRIALFGFGNVGRGFAALLERKRSAYPFRIVAVHTRHGSAYRDAGLGPTPEFGAPAASVDEFLDRARPEIVCELTTLNPTSGEPAITHIRKAFQRGAHVVTANKGPIAHAYAELRDAAAQAGVLFRFESTCMDGAPVYNTFRHNLPGLEVLGFTGVLNSTSKVVVEAMRRGLSMEEGIAEAQRLGIAEADPSYDLDGWDSAAKAAALANVLMDARTTPQAVERRGIGDISPAWVRELAAVDQTVCLVSRAKRTASGIRLQVAPEVLAETDLLASVPGTSNLLLFHTDLMGAIGAVEIAPGVEQTAYGVFSDTVDIARSL